MRPHRAKAPRRYARFAAALLVGIVVVLGVVWASPRTSGAGVRGVSAPQVRVKEIRVSGGLPVAPGRSVAALSGSRAPTSVRSVTLDAGMRFSLVGVVCAAPRAVAGVVVQLRTSDDGRSWSRWYETALERNEQAGHAGEWFTEPVWTGPARYVQVLARARTARAPAALANVRVAVIDSVGSAATVAAGASAAGTAAVSHTPAVTGASLALPVAASSPAAPTIVTRQEWGADESLRKATPSYATVKTAFVHHTATRNTYTQEEAPAIVRAIYVYHTKTLGWGDIGYNFLVDRFGTIYEGRYGGVARGVIGAQVLGFNTGSTGVSVIGTYGSEAPPVVAVASLEALLAWKLSLTGADPSGTVEMTCGATDKYKAGTTVILPVISAHRDANYTDCPGDALYALLPTARTAVADLMNGDPDPPITTATPAPPPNAAGWNNAPVTVTLSATDATSGVASTEYRLQGVAEWTLYATPFTLDTEGSSTWKYRSTDVAGNVETAKAVTVRLDTIKPTTKAYAATVKKGKKVRIRFEASDVVPGCGKATVTLKLFKGKKVKRSLNAGTTTCNVEKSFVWRCTLAKGAYTIKVYATDIADNAQRKTGSARLTVK